MLVKLKDYLDIRRGPGLPSKFYSETGRLIRLTLGNFNYPNGGFKENTSKKDIYYIGNIKKEYILKKGDLITPLTEQVSGLLGETAWIPENNKYIQNGDIGLVIPYEGKLNAKYCYYLLSSPLIKKQLGDGAQQTKIRHTSPEKIKACVAPIPDIKKQELIGKTLHSIDEQINRNKNMIKKLQVLGKMIFERFSLNVNNLVNIKDVCEIIWGQCPDGENILSEESNSTIKYASGAGDIDDGKISINPKAYTDNSRRVVEKYTVCVSVAGTVGKIALSQDKISIGRAMLGLYNKQKYGLIYFSLLKYIPIIQKQATGAIQKIINNNHLEIIYIPVLSFNQINFLNSIIEQCLNIEKKTEQLYSLKNKLLTLLINQQLR